MIQENRRKTHWQTISKGSVKKYYLFSVIHLLVLSCYNKGNILQMEIATLKNMQVQSRWITFFRLKCFELNRLILNVMGGLNY